MTNFPDVDGSEARVRRGVAVLLFVAGIASGPLRFLLEGPVRGDPPKPPPAWTTERLLDGTWSREIDEWLRETSPVTLALRRRFLEAEWLLGLYENDQVVAPTPGWLFLRASLGCNPADLERTTPQRRRFWRSVRERADRLSVFVVVLVAPDKARLHPEHAYAAGRMPALKQGLYALGQRELQEAGIASIDLAAAFDAFRREHPETLLYGRRDTHWESAGAGLAAQLAVERIRAEGIDLGAPEPLELTLQESLVTPDIGIVAQGFRETGGVAERFLERRNFGVTLRRTEAGGRHPLAAEQPDATVALVGDSFANVGFRGILPAIVGRPVDAVSAVAGSGPWRGLDAVLRRIERGELRARAVVCVFVERSLVEAHWDELPEELGR